MTTKRVWAKCSCGAEIESVTEPAYLKQARAARDAAMAAHHKEHPQGKMTKGEYDYTVTLT